MPRPYIALIAPVLLVACQDTPDDENGVDNAAITVSGPYAEGNAQSQASPPGNAIPAAFHGRWGLVVGDCGPDAGAAKGLLTINSGMLRFYESVGEPVAVTYPTPSRVEGRFSFTGEGMDWSKDMELSLESKGNTLIRSERDPAASYTYRRCPA